MIYLLLVISRDNKTTRSNVPLQLIHTVLNCEKQWIFGPNWSSQSSDICWKMLENAESKVKYIANSLENLAVSRTHLNWYGILSCSKAQIQPRKLRSDLWIRARLCLLAIRKHGYTTSELVVKLFVTRYLTRAYKTSNSLKSQKFFQGYLESVS